MSKQHNSISIDDVRKLAVLSALSVNDEEVAALQAELSTIMGYVGQLDEVDVEGLEPTYQVTGLTNQMRDDTLIDYGVTNKQLLDSSPDDAVDGHIKVRRVL